MLSTSLISSAILALTIASATTTHASTNHLCGQAVQARLDTLVSEFKKVQNAHDKLNPLGNKAYLIYATDPRILIHSRTYIKIHKQAEVFEALLFGKVSDNTESDAFRHFFGNLTLARKYSLKTTKIVPFIHDAGQFDLSSLQDKYNNKISYQYATQHLEDLKKCKTLPIDDLGFAKLVLEWTHDVALIAVHPREQKSCEAFDGFFKWADRYLATMKQRLKI